MIKLVDLLKLYNLSHDEICHTVIMAHTEKQEKKKSLGKNITAYDLWRSDFDNRGDNQNDRDLDTEWEFFNRTHNKNALK